jgi:cytochrome c6
MRLFQYSLCLFILLVLGNACGSDTRPTTAQHAAATQPSPPEGAAVYRQYCVACHGADGKLGLNGAGDLTMSKLSLEERITQIAKGKNMMAPFEEMLSPEEIKAVAKYTLSLKK